jgi:hypothetical protein
VHHRAWLAGYDRSIPTVRTARVGTEVAWLDPLEPAARALVKLAQADILEFIAHQFTVEQLFPGCQMDRRSVLGRGQTLCSRGAKRAEWWWHSSDLENRWFGMRLLRRNLEKRCVDGEAKREPQADACDGVASVQMSHRRIVSGEVKMSMPVTALWRRGH